MNTYSQPENPMPIYDLSVQPHAVESLGSPRLARLAANLYWAWQPDVLDLFRAVDPKLMAAGVGPVGILQAHPDAEAKLDKLGRSADLQRVLDRFERYMNEPLKTYGTISPDKPVAYFCAEFGLHDTFAQYSGGLGILAGDHAKEASDLALPFVGVGCFYRLGFFRQLIGPSGRQEHVYPVFHPDHCPIQRVLKPGSQDPLTVTVDLPGRTVHAAVWRAAVGRISLLLLDTDLPENAPEDRPITAQLYMNGREMRLTQELLLGIGGMRALRALDIHPSVFHMNEGHSALLVVERLREHVAAGMSTREAHGAVKAASILTIHTPVPAGNERFDAKLVERMLAPSLAGAGLPAVALLKLGLGEDGDKKVFDMTAFALRHSRAANGVSLLHGEVADETWKSVVGMAVGGVTNGIHMPTWLGPEMRRIFEHQSADFSSGTDVALTERSTGRATWEGIERATDSDLWAARRTQKARLVEFATERLVRQYTRYGVGPDGLRDVRSQLNPDALILGFARRFATYKRASLLFSDPKRLAKLLNNPDRPLQIIFSGKAHPADTPGQALIAEVYAFTQDPRYKGKVFFLEDYDMEVGRMLVQGVDVWLNNPVRPLEASGTSGMKAAANGVPNCSILDGWWDEGYEIGNGFAVGRRTPQKTERAQTRFDAMAMYATIENDIVPTYFDRDAHGVPTEWLKVVRRAVATSVYAFSTRRMLEDYIQLMYQSLE
jgi:starch phosphorylase